MVMLRKRPSPEPLPKDGQERRTNRFAWKPTEVKEGLIWLEWYTVHEVFRVTKGGLACYWYEISVERACAGTHDRRRVVVKFRLQRPRDGLGVF